MERPSSNQRRASKHVASISPLKYGGGEGGVCCQHPLDASLCGPAEHWLCTNSPEACASCQWHRTLGLQISFIFGRVWSGNRAAGLEQWTRRTGKAWGSRGRPNGARNPPQPLVSWESRAGAFTPPKLCFHTCEVDVHNPVMERGG